MNIRNREDLLPAHVIRQMPRTDAVLFHGTLPPVHLRLVKWWRTKELRALVPHNRALRPLKAPSDGTCPLGEKRDKDVESVIDNALVAEQLANLPRPRSAREAGLAAAASARSGRQPAHRPEKPDGQGQLDFTTPPAEPSKPVAQQPVVLRNRVAGRCAVCSTWVDVGAGTNRPYGTRTVIVCDPPCDDNTAENDGTPGVAQGHQTGVVDDQRTAPDVHVPVDSREPSA